MNTGHIFKWQSKKKLKTNLCALSIRQRRFWPISFLMLSMNRDEMKNWFYKAKWNESCGDHCPAPGVAVYTLTFSKAQGREHGWFKLLRVFALGRKYRRVRAQTQGRGGQVREGHYHLTQSFFFSVVARKLPELPLPFGNCPQRVKNK